MGRTQGFDVVAQLAQPALLSLLQAAWDSDLIPKNVPIPAGTLPGQPIEGGQVQIPKSGLGVGLVAGFGIELQLELQIQIKLTNPPVPSAKLIEFVAKVASKVPIVSEPGKTNVVLQFSGVPAANQNDVTLVGGDPIAAKLQNYITDYVHEAYKEDGDKFPHSKTLPQESLIAYKADVTVDLYDDPSDPPHQIQVTFPPNKLRISIPIHVKIFNIQKTVSFAPDLLDPMGVEARLVLLADLQNPTGSVSADLSQSDVLVDNLVPAGPNYPANEGQNYTQNKATLASQIIPINLDDVLKANLKTRGEAMVQGFDPIEFTYPKPDELRGFIATAFRDALVAKPNMEIWPNGAAPPVGVNDLTIVILGGALVIALNARAGATPGAFQNFVPGGKGFAVAVGAEKTMEMVIAARDSQFSLPTTIPDVDGYEVELHSLDPSLTSALHFEGDVTVIDAILDWIDVDAGFEVDVGLEWLPLDVDGLQNIKANPGEPDVSLSGLAWLVSILSGFLLGGVIGLIIGIIVAAVVEDIAENIGGSLVKDQVTNAIKGLQAWPTPLKGVGEVKAAYDKEIDISPDGLLSKG